MILCERRRDKRTLRRTQRWAHAHRRSGKAHQSCTLRGLAFFKKPREAAAVPVSVKSVMTCWQRGCDWLRTVIENWQSKVKDKM